MSRITHHPILGTLQSSERITFQFNGHQYEAYEHETIVRPVSKWNTNIKSS